MIVKIYSPCPIWLDAQTGEIKKKHLLFERKDIERIVIQESTNLIMLESNKKQEFFDHNNNFIEIVEGGP